MSNQCLTNRITYNKYNNTDIYVKNQLGFYKYIELYNSGM